MIFIIAKKFGSHCEINIVRVASKKRCNSSNNSFSENSDSDSSPSIDSN